jgi:ubiquinone/menaquinone biosynthesis C-methylase UbiE
MTKNLAKFAMKIFPYHMALDDRWAAYTYQYIRGDRDNALESAKLRFEFEKEHDFIRNYFADTDILQFKGKHLLELGSFTGGALASWVETYGFAKADGIDVNPLYAQAGNDLAKKMNLPIQYTTGFGEKLPYNDNSFDFVFTHDVLEHVRSVEKTMLELRRVLKPGGKLFCVFPQFLQPLESHLTLATRMPALHWFFSGKVLAKAYYEVIQERGEKAQWYAPKSPELEDWEKLPSLNGISISRFRIIVKKTDWEVLYTGKSPILSDGRRSKWLLFRFLRILFYIPARIPLLEELFRGRVIQILEKNK